MRRFSRKTLAASGLAIIAGIPALAQDDEVKVLAGWGYETLYDQGWSVENMFDMTEVIDTNGEEIGDVENVIFSNEGEVLGIIAQVGGFWDIGDTHVHVPWDEVTMESGIQQMRVPVTEETVDDYDVFGDYWGDEQVVTAEDVDTTQPVDDDLVAGSGIFKATDLMGDYAYLSDGTPYGYVSDLIVQDGSISAVVSDAATYGRPGYFAYPYSYRGDMMGPRYDLPYGATEVDAIEEFNYENLRSRLTE